MSNTFEIQTGPVETPPMTEDDHSRADQKLETYKASRASRKARAVEPENAQIAMAQIGDLPEIAGTQDEEPEALAPVSIEDGWPVGPSGERVSPKYARMLAERKAEALALEAIAEPEAVDLEAYEAFKLSMLNCQKVLDDLLAEMAGLQGRMDDAVQAGDFPQLQVLKQRRALVPWELEAARFVLAEARIPYLDLKMAKLRAETILAETRAHEVTEAQRLALQQLHEAQMEAQDSRQAYQDARLALGEAKRERGDLLMAMASQADPVAHRAPRVLHLSGADLSGLMPMKGGQHGQA